MREWSASPATAARRGASAAVTAGQRVRASPGDVPRSLAAVRSVLRPGLATVNWNRWPRQARGNSRAPAAAAAARASRRSTGRRTLPQHPAFKKNSRRNRLHRRRRDTGENMGSYDHPGAGVLASELSAAVPDITVARHLSKCLACRVHSARLRHALKPGGPGDDIVERILQASAAGPAVPAGLSSWRSPEQPQPGELWRIGQGEALLAWVRRVLDDEVDVIPAVLDTELADSESVIIPASATELGTRLVLLAGVRGRVGLDAMTHRIGYIDAFAQVQETRMAAREGREPRNTVTGAPVTHPDDPRIYYRHVISDLLADLVPGGWPDDM